MKRYYIKDITDEPLKEGDIVYFEMPPFCSGEYDATIKKDENGLYVDKDEYFFESCRDWRVGEKYWE